MKVQPLRPHVIVRFAQRVSVSGAAQGFNRRARLLLCAGWDQGEAQVSGCVQRCNPAQGCCALLGRDHL